MNTTRSCPHCKAPVPKGGANLPFCSERCRVLDLGAWALERYRVPGASVELESDEISDPSISSHQELEEPSLRRKGRIQ